MLRILFILAIILYSPIFLLSKTVIVGDKAHIQYKEQKFHLQGNVKVTTEEAEITAGQLDYIKLKKIIIAKDNVVVNLFKENTTIKADQFNKNNNIIILSMKKGQVVTQKDNQITKSDKVHMTTSQNKSKTIQFIGKPNLESDSFNLKSEKSIIYKTDTKKTNFQGIVDILTKKDQYAIKSKDVVYDNNTKEIIFQGTVTINDPKDRYLKGNKGTYHTESELLTLSKDVQFIGNQSEVNSDLLKTVVEKKNVYYVFTENVKVKAKDFNGTSNILRYNKTLSLLELLGNVVFTNKSNGMILTCERINIDETTGETYFYDKLVIKQGKKTIKGKFATYNNKTQIFTINGDVELIEEGSVYNSNRATYNSKTSVVELIGNIRGESKLNQLKGIKIDKE